ncbi:hypothetical protein G6F56_012765 [Rhizopus delemar]|nr:hypothetical protein G6F56_012765 [Rhizopus delemar]
MQQVALNYAKKHVIGKASEYIHTNRPSYETDPEVLEAIEEANRNEPRWKRTMMPDVILKAQERKVLKRVKRNAWYLDKGCYCCGLNIGLDGLVGLIPGVGDFIGSLMAMHLIRTACEADLPNWLIAKMLWNVLIDFMVGLAPIAGDLLDVLFKCNWRNAILLEEFLILRRRDEIRREKEQGKKMASSSHDPNRDLENTSSHGIENMSSPKESKGSMNKKKKYGTF